MHKNNLMGFVLFGLLYFQKVHFAILSLFAAFLFVNFRHLKYTNKNVDDLIGESKVMRKKDYRFLTHLIFKSFGRKCSLPQFINIGVM